MEPQRHPKGLYVLFFTEMWERFGFYTMGAMFTLYLREAFSWSSAEAANLNSWYLMFVYASPLVGGWLADRWLGYCNSVLIGGLIFMVGYLLFGFPSIWMVYAALTCLVLGNGFFKPNVSAMVGHLYPEGSPLKDRAFNIFYMGINIGAFFAPLVAEYVSGAFGFRPAFMVAAGGMVISVAILATFRKYVEGPSGASGEAAAQEKSVTTAELTPEKKALEGVSDAKRIGALLVIFAIVIVFWMAFHQNTSTLVFWANDNTDWTWLNQVTGREISGILSNAINAFFVVAFTFPLVWFWKWLNDRGLEPSTPTKIAFGMVLTAVSFAILYAAARAGEEQTVGASQLDTGDFRLTELALENLAAQGVPPAVLQKLESKDADGKFLIKSKKFAADQSGSGEQHMVQAIQTVLGSETAAQYQERILSASYLYKVSPFWLILAYAVITLGELMLSPMGLALVSKVAPVRMRGLMMGGWFVATAIGNKLTAIAVYWDVWYHSTFFAVLGGLSLLMAFVLLFLIRPLKKAMPGV